MTSAGGGFTLSQVDVALPLGASARAHRRLLSHRGRPLFGLTQGRFRACLYPVFSPRGFPLTSESPSDHPHHNSIWAAADHVHAHVPVAGGGIESYAYNFYVDDVFQGRAPARIVEVDAGLAEAGPGRARLTQELEWRGPSEWGAPEGRLVLRETRRIDVGVAAEATTLDLMCELRAQQWDVSIGPTRHAFFNMRVSDAIATAPDVTCDRGAFAKPTPSAVPFRWVNIQGPVGGGNVAGIAMMPHPDDHPGLDWFVTNWGVATARPRLDRPLSIRSGDMLRLRCRYLLHDGLPEIGSALLQPPP